MRFTSSSTGKESASALHQSQAQGQKLSGAPARQRPFSAGPAHRACRGTSSVAQRLARNVQLAAVAAPEAPKQEPPPEDRKVEVDGIDIIDLAGNVTMLRGVCSDRLKYDIEYSRKRGTTDNSYILKGDGEAVLIDVLDEVYADQFVSTLEKAVPLASITTLVITHLTPRRVTSLTNFLRARTGSAPQLDVYLSNPGVQAIRGLLGKAEGGPELLSKINVKAAKSGDSLTVGKEEELRLIPTPTPRWPDLLCAYNLSSRLLFTSKFFSAHVAPTAAGAPAGSPYDAGGWEEYETDWHFFFDCMIAPVARQASGALEKLRVVSAPSFGKMSVMDALQASLRTAQEALEGSQSSAFGDASMGRTSAAAMVVTAICPLHGPVVQSSVTELLYKYREWTQEQIKSLQACSVAVMYASAYGNTASLAQAISRGITKAGVGVETLNLESAELSEVNDSIAASSGFVIGSPTLGGHMPTQVATALGAVLRNEKAKSQLCGVFGSFGWSGEAVDELEKRLQDAGFRFAFDSLRVKFKPSAKDMQTAEESGTDLAQALLKRRNKEQKQKTATQPKTSLANETEKAVGRIVGALCALTVKDEDAESAMLASWISQASFDPPGLTVAVKKDRAAENLLGTGSKFVVNILAEGNHKKLMGQLLKPFKPGENRFEGLDISESEGNAGVVLPGCASYVDCTVATRMDAGDHYIVYATIDFGKVVDPNAVSAVHHRQAGTTY